MSRNDESTQLLPKHEEDDDLEKDLKESSLNSRNDVPKEEDSFGNQILNFYNKVLLHRNPDDDLVTVSVKKFNLFILGSLLCWLISFAMIMTQIITSYTAFSGNWLCFIPMWIGSFIGLFGVFRVFLTVCRPSSLITRERKHYLQRYYPQSFQERNYIEQQSLPLMRRLFCWSIVLAITYFLLLIAQICYYFWFIKVLSIWDSIISLTLILSTFMIYMYTVHIFNWIICILFSLFVLQLGLFIMKETGNIQASWIILSLPLFISLIGIGYYLIKILRAFFQSKYHFNFFQSICLGGYIMSYLLVASGSGLTLADSYTHDLRYVTTAYICWTVAVCIVGLCGVLVLFEEGIRSAENRGYENPPVLTRTAEGWDVIEVEENPLLFILGAVRRENGRVNHVRRKQQEKVNATKTTKHEKVISYQNGTFDEKKLVTEGKNKPPTKEVELKTFADRR